SAGDRGCISPGFPPSPSAAPPCRPPHSITTALSTPTSPRTDTEQLPHLFLYVLLPPDHSSSVSTFVNMQLASNALLSILARGTLLGVDFIGISYLSDFI
ncbi:MAG: hypothetical protein ACREFA_04185, partial [Stellaceae bacterium]